MPTRQQGEGHEAAAIAETAARLRRDIARCRDELEAVEARTQARDAVLLQAIRAATNDVAELRRRIPVRKPPTGLGVDDAQLDALADQIAERLRARK